MFPLTPLILLDFQISSLSDTLLFQCIYDEFTKNQDNHDHLHYELFSVIQTMSFLSHN